MLKNKGNFGRAIHKRMTKQDKVYGTTTMGARGQVVVPALARKDLGLEPGDQLLVTGKFGKALGFIKVDELEGFAKIMMDNLAGSGMEGHMKAYMQKMLKNLSINNKGV
jgi:AbrB family looped-hinge helix DNA binding protein